MSHDFTLVVFPIARAGAWEWIAGDSGPGLSSNGDSPASHRWFSIQPTAPEDTRIDSTMTGEDVRLTVDLDTGSPGAIIEGATGLKPITPPID